LSTNVWAGGPEPDRSRKKINLFVTNFWWNEIKDILLQKQINNAYATQTI
jgi:hypothetical protein